MRTITIILPGLTLQFLLSQQTGLLQQTKEAGHSEGHKLMQGAVLPRGRQTSVSVSQQSLCLLGCIKQRSSELLEQLAVSGLERMLTLKTTQLQTCCYCTGSHELCYKCWLLPAAGIQGGDSATF